VSGSVRTASSGGAVTFKDNGDFTVKVDRKDFQVVIRVDAGSHDPGPEAVQSREPDFKVSPGERITITANGSFLVAIESARVTLVVAVPDPEWHDTGDEDVLE
jgi:hypothetical protein